MLERRDFLTAVSAGAALICVRAASGQTAGRIPRIGFVAGRDQPAAANPDPTGSAFRDELQRLGLTDGKNIHIEYRYAGIHRDRAREVTGELVRLPVDVLVTGNSNSMRAAKAASSSVPIVIVTVEDPVAAGYVESLAHPGGNVTGVTRLTAELVGKRIELLKEILPRLRHVGVVYITPGIGREKQYQPLADALKVRISWLPVQEANPDLVGTIRAAVSNRVEALIVTRNPVLVRFKKEFFELALKNRLITICEGDEEVEAGGLVSYAVDDAAAFRRAAYYVSRILKGAKPGELPVEQSTALQLVINLKTAKAMGITIPQSILVRADRVIE